MKQISRAIVLIALAVLIPGRASAESFGFTCLTQNNAATCGVLQDQLRLDIVNTPLLPFVGFLFTNAGPTASAITGVYFDDTAPALLGSPTLRIGGSNVAFSKNCSPANLPGGDLIGFSTSYCAGAKSPRIPKGVGPDEWLLVTYTLQGSATFADVLAAASDGIFRIGVQVEGFAGGGSASGIANTASAAPSPVPEPATLVLVGMDLMLVALLARRQRPLGRRPIKASAPEQA